MTFMKAWTGDRLMLAGTVAPGGLEGIEEMSAAVPGNHVHRRQEPLPRIGAVAIGAPDFAPTPLKIDSPPLSPDREYPEKRRPGPVTRLSRPSHPSPDFICELGGTEFANQPRMNTTSYPLLSLPDERLPSTHPSILLVDDDSDTREFVKEILTRKGFRVETASTGRDAIRLATAGHTPPPLQRASDASFPSASFTAAVTDTPVLALPAVVWP